MRKLNKRKMGLFLINDQNIIFGHPPLKKLEISKKANQLILINVQNNFLIDPFLLREYNVFSQNTESSLEQ